MRSLPLLAFAALLLPGCIGWHTLGSSERPALAGGDALLVLAADADGELLTSFCRDGDYANCISPASLSRGSPITVLQLPAGRYCLLQVIFRPSGATEIESEFEPERADCFDVAGGALNYPGHVVYESELVTGAVARTRMGWQSRSTLHDEVVAAYPELAMMETTSIPIVRGPRH